MEKLKDWKDDIFKYLPQEIIDAINKLPMSALTNISEIRLRSGGFCSISVKGENKPLCVNINPIMLTFDSILQVFNSLFNNEIFKYEKEIKNGYFTIKGGHRVGFCGSAVYNGDNLISVTDITSIVFRVSRQIIDAAGEVITHIYNGQKIESCLIVSEPGAGKTTILTDLTRLLSNAGKRCAVIDERYEICSVFKGEPQKDVGPFTDILNGYTKGEGMMCALRSLSPQVLICDEIGSVKDVDAMLEATNAGVPVIATAHALCESELYERPQIERLINHGAINKIIFLKSSKTPGKIKKVITVNNYDEDYWNSDNID